MVKQRTISLVALLTTIVVLAGVTSSFAQVSNVQIENEYIRIVVNTDQNNTGRFSVGTTGGDPDRTTDRNMHLIYGGSDPWTSYTTVRIGNQNWVYGGPTDRRAGFDALYGEMVQPPTVVDGKIESSWILGPIQVWQVLSLTRSSTTGLMDTAHIEYHVENLDSESHMVGLRLMLDTMLGTNDGAPFRVDDRGLTTDTVFYYQNMPEFWQAFDSLSNPRVMAQGTLTGPGVTSPDRVYFTNWGILADNPWNFNFQPGRDFIRTGEFELDSAIAMFWDQVNLAPGESRSFVSYYGLGGVTIAPGDLILGVTSPAQVPANPDGFETFSIIAYVENDGEGEARDVIAELKLPPGLQLIGTPARVRLNDLAVGETEQTGWQIRAQQNLEGVLTYEVEVSAINSEPNRVRRNVEILSPADLQVLFSGPTELVIKNEQYDPAVFETVVTLSNQGGTQYYGGTFEILHPLGLDLVSGQSAKKFPGTIEAGEELSFKWLLKPIDGFSGILPYSLRVTSDRGPQIVRNNSIIVPELRPKVWVGEPQVARGSEVREGDYFSVPIWATNIHDFLGAELDLFFNPEHLEIVGKTLDISRGTLFVDSTVSPAVNLAWQLPSVSNSTGEVLGIRGDRGAGNELDLSYGTLATIHFRAKSAGLARIDLEEVRVFTTHETFDASRLVIEHRDIIIQPEQ